MAETLSASEQKVFDAIVGFITDTKYPPTIRELRDLTGYNSTSTIHDKLRKLKEKGLIYFAANEKRTIRILTPTEDVVPVVRCKDCKFSRELDKHCEINRNAYMHCDLLKGDETKYVWHKYKKYHKDYSIVEPDDYCSYGERK